MTTADLIRPIETEYRGYRFRSRFEARWAVFFDAACPFVYGGPSLIECHGVADHTLASRCVDEVSEAEALFGWIDRIDTIGTMVEIGAAYAMQKPIFLAFACGLDDHFYFARDLATVAVQAPSAVAAWELFTRWRNL